MAGVSAVTSGRNSSTTATPWTRGRHRNCVSSGKPPLHTLATLVPGTMIARVHRPLSHARLDVKSCTQHEPEHRRAMVLKLFYSANWFPFPHETSVHRKTCRKTGYSDSWQVLLLIAIVCVAHVITPSAPRITGISAREEVHGQNCNALRARKSSASSGDPLRGSHAPVAATQGNARTRERREARGPTRN